MAFTKGVAKGTASLVGNTSYGVLDTAMKLTQNVGDTVAALSSDRAYRLQRKDTRRKIYRIGPKLRQDVTQSIVGGISGIVMEPARAIAAGKGIGGCIKSLKLGLVSGVVKPTVGVLDLATHLTEGVRDMAGSVIQHTHYVINPVDRKRLSQRHGPDGRLLHLQLDELWVSRLPRLMTCMNPQ